MVNFLKNCSGNEIRRWGNSELAETWKFQRTSVKKKQKENGITKWVTATGAREHGSPLFFQNNSFFILKDVFIHIIRFKFMYIMLLSFLLWHLLFLLRTSVKYTKNRFIIFFYPDGSWKWTLKHLLSLLWQKWKQHELNYWPIFRNQ